MKKKDTGEIPKNDRSKAGFNIETADFASSIINNTSDAVIAIELNGEITLWNNGAVECYGYTSEEALGKNISFIYRKEDLPLLDKRIKKVIQGENISNAEVIIIDKSKNERTVLLSINGIKDKKGKVTQMVGLTKDISEQKQADIALKTSEENYRSIFEQSLVGIGMSKGNEVIFANKALLQIFKYNSLEEFKKVPLIDHIAPASKQLIKKRQEEVLANNGANLPSEFQYDILCHNGETRTLQAHTSPVEISGQKYSQTIVIDVTEQNKSKIELIKVKEKAEQVERKLTFQLQSTLNNISDGFVSLDTNWCYTYINIKAAEIFGRSQEDLIGKHIWTEFPEGVGLPFYNAYYKAVDSQKTVYFEEFYEPFNKWFENRIYPSSDGLTIYFTDITEKKQAEIALRSSEEKFRNLAETAQVAISIFGGAAGKEIFYVNTYWENLTGYSKEEAKDLNIMNIIAEEHLAMAGERAAKRLAGEEVPTQYELKFITKSGKTKWVDFSATLTEFDGEKAILTTSLDITKQKEEENQLVKAKEKAVISENYLDNIINNIGDPLFVKDAQSRMILVNDAFCTLFDLTRDKIIGKTLAEDVSLNEQESFLRIDKQVLKTGQESIVEESLTIRSGQTKTISTRKTRYIDSYDKKYLIGVIRDITERVNTEIEFKKAQKIARVGSWYIDVLTHEMVWSEELYKMYGFDLKRSIPPLSEHGKYLTPESYELVSSCIENTIKTGKPYSVELKGAEGVGINWKWMLGRGEAVFDSENKIIGVRGTGQDITAQKEAEEELKETHSQLRIAVDSVKLGVWSLTINTDALVWNEELFKIYGVDPTEFVPNMDAFQKLVHPEDLEYVMSHQGEVPDFKFRIIRPNKEVRYINGSVLPITVDGEVVKLIGVNRDITERIKDEKRLQDSKTKFEILSNVTFEGILIHEKGVPIDMNNSFPQMFGYTKDEFIDTDLIKLIIQKDYNNIVNENIKNEYQIPYEVIGIKKNGTEFPLEIEGRTYTSEENNKYRVTAIRDITDRKIAEEKIKESEEKYRTLFEQSLVGIGMTKSIEVEFANKAMLDIFNYDSLEEFKKTPLLDLIVPDYRDLIRNRMKDGLTNMGKDFNPYYEYEILCKGGGIKSVMGHTSYIQIGGETYAQTIVSDITERKKSEKKLQVALLQLTELKQQIEAENIYLKEELKLDGSFNEIVGSNKLLKKTLKQVEQVAKTDATVLILGETGTGKELIARAIHNASNRKDKPMIKVNCSALPAELIESEFFGHEIGAFTGAVKRKIGRFELANGGTIFLDEIGDLPIGLQTRLLRVLQESEFERVGGETTIKVDVRVITATNRNLEKRVLKNKFRQDLYYRLNVFPIECPPLRDRIDDIPSLVHHFVNKYNPKVNNKIKTVNQKTIERLILYNWPGNIRELENVIERAIIVNHGGQLRLGKWFMDSSLDTIVSDDLSTLEIVERDYIIKVLEKTNWKIRGKNGAAEILGMQPTTLESRMKKRDISRKK